MNVKVILPALVAVALFSSCDPTDLLPDGGVKTDGGGTTVYALVPGTYVASAASAPISDGCNQDPNNTGGSVTPLAGTTFELTNVSGLVGLGAIVGNPAQPAQGSGQINNNAGTLTRDNDVSTENGACTYHRKVTNVVTVTANNAMTMNHTRVDSNAVGCTVITNCTTSFTWSVTKQ